MTTFKRLIIWLVLLFCFWMMGDVEAQVSDADWITTIPAKLDTTESELIIAVDSVWTSENTYFKFPAKVLIVIDGYRVYNNQDWRSFYLDDKKQRIKDVVYIATS